jgi:hypothetical protein
VLDEPMTLRLLADLAAARDCLDRQNDQLDEGKVKASALEYLRKQNQLAADRLNRAIALLAGLLPPGLARVV